MWRYPALLDFVRQPIRLPGVSVAAVYDRQGIFEASSGRAGNRRYRNLRAIAPNGLNRTTFHCLFAERFFFR
jgi:hypothetical protein